MDNTAATIPMASLLKVIEPGQTILVEGESSTDAYLLRVGRAEVVVQGIVVGELAAGEMFGMLAALTGGVRSATVKALDRCEIEVLGEQDLSLFIRQNPEATEKLLREMAQTIAKLDKQYAGMKNDPVVRAMMRTLR